MDIVETDAINNFYPVRNIVLRARKIFVFDRWINLFEEIVSDNLILNLRLKRVYGNGIHEEIFKKNYLTRVVK